MRRNRSRHETVKTDINSGAGGTASAAGPRTFSGCMAGAGCREKACIREASEAETDGGDVAENEKNGAAGNLEDDGSSAGEVIQDDADENASDVEAALKRRISRKQLYKRKKEFQKAQEETVYMPPTIWLATDLHYQSPQMTDFQSAFDTYTMGNDGTIRSRRHFWRRCGRRIHRHWF